MMEEINNFFLAAGGALVYWTEPMPAMHKRYSTTFVWANPFSTYVSYNRFFITLPLYAPVHILDDPSPFPQLRVYLMNGLFLNQITYKNIRISYSLKYKHSKKKFFTKK